MISYLLFVILIASIHLIASLLLRRKKLPKQQYEFPIIQMIELALIAILGIMVIPDIALNYRLILVLAACITLTIFSVWYDHSKRPKVRIQPFPIKQPKRRRSSDNFNITIKKATLRNTLNAMMVTIEFFEALFFTVYLPMTS